LVCFTERKQRQKGEESSFPPLRVAAFQKSYHLFWSAAQLARISVDLNPSGTTSNLFVSPGIDVTRVSPFKELVQHRRNNVLIQPNPSHYGCKVKRQWLLADVVPVQQAAVG
jgi:hypothetical protein